LVVMAVRESQRMPELVDRLDEQTVRQ
jgi:hypothetical protein